MINDNWQTGLLALIGSFVTTIETMKAQLDSLATEVQAMRGRLNGEGNAVPAQEGQEGEQAGNADEGR